MVETILKPHNLDSAVKKDLVAAPLVIEEKENLDDLTLEITHWSQFWTRSFTQTSFIATD